MTSEISRELLLEFLFPKSEIHLTCGAPGCLIAAVEFDHWGSHQFEDDGSVVGCTAAFDGRSRLAVVRRPALTDLLVPIDPEVRKETAADHLFGSHHKTGMQE